MSDTEILVVRLCYTYVSTLGLGTALRVVEARPLGRVES